MPRPRSKPDNRDTPSTVRGEVQFAALGLSALPPGFARFATPAEEAVIAGHVAPTVCPRAESLPERGNGPAARPGDRFRLLNGLADFHLAGLTKGEVKVWLVLFRDARDGVARTGQADLARRCGLSVRGVQKVLARLAGKGLVAVTRRGRLGAGPSSYRILLPTDGRAPV